VGETSLTIDANNETPADFPSPVQPLFASTRIGEQSSATQPMFLTMYMHIDHHPSRRTRQLALIFETVPFLGIV
jgi:hypothetical protein